MCKTVLCQDYITLIQTFPQSSEHRYTTMARSPGMAPIEYVWDILESNARCRHDVRTRPLMIIALRCVVNGQRSPRMTSEPLLVRCFADALLYAD